jgi:mRNA-degrading endonuclease toxin of MazEF toxin-antitoxin module
MSRKSAARRIYPNEVLLPTGVAGLSTDSIALCYQIRTLDRGRLASLTVGGVGTKNGASAARLPG